MIPLRHFFILFCCWFGVSFSVCAEGNAAPGGCEAEEPWGRSVFSLGRAPGITHLVQVKGAANLTEARFIETKPGVRICAVQDRALVYVVPEQGVYQVDRDLDTPKAPIWIADVPDHYSQQTQFQKRDGQLRLVTGAMETIVTIDTEVRNDSVPVVYPKQEVALESELVGAVAQQTDHVALQLALGDYTFSSLGFAPAPPGVRVQDGSLELSGTTRVQFDGTLLGSCSQGSQTIVYAADGLVRRLEIDPENALFEMGQFQLSGPAQHCLIDMSEERLYVAMNEVVMWVFDLSQAGLNMPRAVTTYRALDSMQGIATHEAGYILTLSEGDGVFLIFRSDDMRLVGRFKVGADVPRGMDGVLRTRGFGILHNAGARFPQGVLVIHDEHNRLPDEQENLKLIDWRDIEAVITVGEK